MVLHLGKHFCKALLFSSFSSPILLLFLLLVDGIRGGRLCDVHASMTMQEESGLFMDEKVLNREGGERQKMDEYEVNHIFDVWGKRIYWRTITRVLRRDMRDVLTVR